MTNSLKSACISSVMLLRYYATFKVTKFVSLFYKLNTCLQKTTTYVGLQAEPIFPVTLLKVTLLHGCFLRFLNCTNGAKSRNASHIIYPFFNFGRGFCDSFSMLLPKDLTSCGKKFLK